MKTIRIEQKRIGEDSPVFLIAEAGVNHNGEIDIAKKLIDLAVTSDVDAIKFQTFNTDNLVLKETPKADYQKISDNDQEDFYDMLKKYELSRKEFKLIRNYCLEKGIIFLSTPFDDSSVNLLEDLNISAFKVSSGDMNNYPLLKLICSKGKPILLSTGMATIKEVKDSVNFIKSNGIYDIVIFQCTSNYPASLENLNLNVIDTYRKEFPADIIGFSDHSIGVEASIGAVAKGVKVIEKHLTLNNAMEGPDHKASMNPEDLNRWVNAIRNIEKALGKYLKIPSEYELEVSKVARKSIVSTTILNKGDTITEQKITVKRPGIGIPPTFFYEIIAKKMKVKNTIPKGSIIQWDDLEK